MGLFRKTSPQRDLAKMKTRLAELQAQTATLEGEIESERQGLESALIEGRDEAAISKIETVVADTIRRRDAVASATTALAKQIEDRETEIAAAAQQLARETEAKRLEANLKSTEAAAATLREAAANFLAEIEPLANLNWSARQWHTLIGTVSHELPTGTDLIASETRALINSVLNGASSIQKPPAQAEPKASPIEMPMRRVVSLASMKWTVGDGIKTVAKHQQVEIPVEIADRAISLRWARDWSDHNARSLVHGHTAAPSPNDPDLIDLDDPALQPRKPSFGRDRIQENAGFVEFTPRRAVG